MRYCRHFFGGLGSLGGLGRGVWGVLGALDSSWECHDHLQLIRNGCLVLHEGSYIMNNDGASGSHKRDGIFQAPGPFALDVHRLRRDRIRIWVFKSECKRLYP